MESSAPEIRRHSRRLIAVLRALIRRSAESATDKRDYAERLECRVGALARVQEMIFRNPLEGVDLQELIQGELLAQVIPDSRCQVSGPDTRIAADAALPLALALHELAVNSILHGAMQDERAALRVSWEHLEQDAHCLLRLTWRETGATSQGHPPTNKGFGLELIERTLPYELDACTRVTWQPSGLRVEIDIPTLARRERWTPVAGVVP